MSDVTYTESDLDVDEMVDLAQALGNDEAIAVLIMLDELGIEIPSPEEANGSPQEAVAIVTRRDPEGVVDAALMVVLAVLADSL